MKNIPKTEDLFDLGHTIARGLLEGTAYPHEALPKLNGFISELSKCLPSDYEEAFEGVFISKGASVSDSATLLGPTIICNGAEIRTGAFIRGSVIIGEGVVIGNSSEVKNSVILDEAKLPHYNYVGDSIIGYRSHMGAGAIASNLRLDKRSVLLRADEEKIDTGLKKFGVMLGDYTEVGCGSVLSPGTIIGRECIIYPLSDVRGIIPERSIFDKEIKERFNR